MNAQATLSPAGLAERFGVLLGGLRFCLRRRAFALGLVQTVLLRWLDRMEARFVALMGRLAAGKLRPARVRRAGTRRERVAGAEDGAWPAMPREVAWLLKREGAHVSSITNALHALLHDAEVTRLLAEARTAMRLVRPLARMLGVREPAPLRLARRPRKRKAAPAVARERDSAGLAWPERSLDPLWYPNGEGRPVDLRRAAKKIGRGGR